MSPSSRWKRLLPVVCTAALLLLSCGGKKEPLPFYGNDDIPADTATSVTSDMQPSADPLSVDESAVIVPFKEEGGVKYVNVTVNGFGFEMIFDTGCSVTMISVAEANYLYEKGYLTQEDYLGNTKSQIADGSIVENMVFRLREVVIGDKIRCKDVLATVSANNDAPLLLGNEVLDRVASYTIDNEHKVIHFKLR